MKEGKLRDRCPACGAPKTAFQPYTDPVAAPRRRRLNMDLHPIAVHFATSFAVAALVFSVANIFLSGDALKMLIDATKIITLLLPLLVIGTILLGILDGKIRFRKIKNSQILKRKIVYGIILLAVTAVLAAIIWIDQFTSVGWSIIAALLAAAAVVLVYLLGLLGMSIREAIFPGN
jgi:uncharacterized membrane protein